MSENRAGPPSPSLARATSPVRMFLAMSPFDVNVGARRATLCHVVDSIGPKLPLRISHGPFFASSLNHLASSAS